MAGGGGIRMVSNAVAAKHRQMLNASNKVQAVLARDIYRMYQNAQVERFDSIPGNQGGVTSQGDVWPSLGEPYKTYKPRRFLQYPEGGRRMLIATGSLLKTVVGTSRSTRNPESGARLRHQFLATNRQMTVAVSGDYARAVDNERPFMHFSREFWRGVNARVREYFYMGR